MNREAVKLLQDAIWICVSRMYWLNEVEVKAAYYEAYKILDHALTLVQYDAKALN